jgi:hypothetical protein
VVAIQALLVAAVGVGFVLFVRRWWRGSAGWLLALIAAVLSGALAVLSLSQRQWFWVAVFAVLAAGYWSVGLKARSTRRTFAE